MSYERSKEVGQTPSHSCRYGEQPPLAQGYAKEFQRQWPQPQEIKTILGSCLASGALGLHRFLLSLCHGGQAPSH